MKPSTSALALEQPVITKDRVDDALKSPQLQRGAAWSQNLAVGHKGYVEGVKSAFDITGRHKTVVEGDDAFSLKESTASYSVYLEDEVGALNTKRAVLLV